MPPAMGQRFLNHTLKTFSQTSPTVSALQKYSVLTPSIRRDGQIRNGTPGKEINMYKAALLAWGPKPLHKPQSPKNNLLCPVRSIIQGLCLLPYRNLVLQQLCKSRRQMIHLCEAAAWQNHLSLFSC